MSTKPSPPDWLSLGRELFSLAQAGLTYCHSEYDLERYRRLREISAQVLAAQTDLQADAVLTSLSLQSGYATPKVDVRAAVFKDDRILLVREESDRCWTMPGGWADLGDSPSASILREVREESGFDVRVEKLVAVLDANRMPGSPMELYHAYKLLFLCTLTGGEARPSHETPQVDFFPPDSLPPISPFRTSLRMIQAAVAHHADPSAPSSRTPAEAAPHRKDPPHADRLTSRYPTVIKKGPPGFQPGGLLFPPINFAFPCLPRRLMRTSRFIAWLRSGCASTCTSFTGRR